MTKEHDYCSKCCGVVYCEGDKCPVSLEKVSEMKECPIAGPNSSLLTRQTFTFEIYYQDLNEEAQKQLDQITDGDHNYDIHPLAELVIERDVVHD